MGSWRGIARFVEQQALRARLRWSHWSLDAELAMGTDPASDPALALRAAQLGSDRHRRRLAGWVERLVRDADASRSPGRSAAAPIVCEQVTEARDSLIFLAAVLRNAKQVHPRGLAMVKRLLSDAGSVLYTDGARGAVELHVRTALDHLIDQGETIPETSASARISASATPEGRPRWTQIA
jgi:hypothetical protein